jgi:SAM-dependent methyltransferase
MSLFRRKQSAAAPPAGTLRLPAEHLALLRCPDCRGELHRDGGDEADMVCAQLHRWPIVHGVPVFSDEGRDVAVRPLEHESHQPTPELLRHLEGATKPWLHLGAGASAVPIPNSIELETVVFKHTHVVGDVHRLPFADASLGGVLALNVFEHLSDPDRAAAELRRVLAPGAKVVIHTAFLQPLHADPYHFYNTTETGLRRWFQDFDIDAVTVPGNFNPGYAFSWMASDLLFGSAENQSLANATVAQLSGFWRDPSTRVGPVWDAFQQLPDATQRILAAGFQMVATRPDSPQGPRG